MGDLNDLVVNQDDYGNNDSLLQFRKRKPRDSNRNSGKFYHAYIDDDSESSIASSATVENITLENNKKNKSIDNSEDGEKLFLSPVKETKPESNALTLKFNRILMKDLVINNDLKIKRI